MEISKRKSISDSLSKYDYLADKDDFIEITEWTNGEGWDICTNKRQISLTFGELEAIYYLAKYLEYNKE